MYVLIAGEDEVAFRTAELLMHKHPVVLIGPEPHAVPRIDRLDVELVPGQPSDPSVLERAHASKAEVFVACTDNDEQNIVACLAARRLGARHHICVLSRRGSIAVEESDEALAESLGIDAIVRPAVSLAQEILRIVTVPGALDVEHFAGGQVVLLRHIVEGGSALPGAPLRQRTLPAEVVLCMVRRGEEIFIPNGDTVFEVGDRVTAMGSPKGIRQLEFEMLRAPSHVFDKRSATVVGGGVVGGMVAKGLEDEGWRVKVIERDYARCEELAVELRSLVLHGDATEEEVLVEEQVDESPVLVAVTDNDEKNLLVALMAKSLGVERVITRAERLDHEKMFERLGVDVVRSARGAAIRTVVENVVDAQAAIVAELEHGDVHVIEVELKPHWRAVRLTELKASLFCIVGAVTRGRRTFIPDRRTKLFAGDRLLVFTSKEDEDQTRAFFEHPFELGEELPVSVTHHDEDEG